jgi:nucleotide-binding universal stress UspA family protein
MIHIKKILYPTDFSSHSNQAYFHAVALAEKHGASLTIVYVYAPSFGTPEVHDEGSNGREYWRSQLEQIRPVDTRIPVHHVFLEGDPATEIVRYAVDAGVDLIVMGTHGRTGLERLLMGSVAEKVMRDAPCSVLVVKLPKGIPAPVTRDVEVAVSPTA